MAIDMERDVESYLVRRAKDCGGIAVKFIPDNKRGFPDRIVILPRGRLVWVELKRPRGGRVSPAQRVCHEYLGRLGQDVRVIWTKSQVDDLLSGAGE